MVLKRSNGIVTGERQEYINFISANYSKGYWKFKLNKVVQYSYSYSNSSFPTLSDQEITLRTLRKLIDEGYMNDSNTNINQSFFVKPNFDQ